MDVTESCVPPGFRFHPTDEELVGYYLKKKVASESIDLDVIRDVDLYRIEPWDLQERCRIGYEQQNEWYFFSHRDKKYPTGTRTNRATMAGFWKATGRDKAVHDKSRLIGMRKTLVFYKGRAPNGQKTDWIMHEYRLESDENGPPQEEGWVVCRAFKKRTPTCQMRVVSEPWDATYGSYDGTSVLLGSAFEPNGHFHHLPRAPPPPPRPSFVCKQEVDLEHLSFLRATSQFIQLPQLESPSLPPAKRPDALSITFEKQEEDEAAAAQVGGTSCTVSSEKVTDWRALDKFVASQLGPEERLIEAEGLLPDFTSHNHSENVELLLHDDRGEELGQKNMNGFLTTSTGKEYAYFIE